VIGHATLERYGVFGDFRSQGVKRLVDESAVVDVRHPLIEAEGNENADHDHHELERKTAEGDAMGYAWRLRLLGTVFRHYLQASRRLGVRPPPQESSGGAPSHSDRSGI